MRRIQELGEVIVQVRRKAGEIRPYIIFLPH
jgi:hypothetical protein